jgi:inhibitor of cysteine peptidase
MNMNNLRIFQEAAAIGLIAISVALFGGCDQSDDNTSSQEATVYLKAEDNGDTVAMHNGDKLEIALPSNPSTGYEWEIASFDKSILEEGNHEYIQDPSPGPEPIVGSGGTNIFRFAAISTGRTPLTLIYHRSWENLPPEETFEVQIVVQ